MSKRRNILGLGCAAAMAATMVVDPVHAGGFTAADIQFLYGADQGDFKEFNGNLFPMWTFEVANGWTYGDNFFFSDVNYGPNYDKKKAISTYSEIHSRLSYSKISGQQIALGPISDLSLAGETDLPSSFQSAYCYGLGVDLKIPGFAFAFVNFFVRDEIATKGVSFQINPVWMVPFDIGGLKGSFGGWLDYMTGEGDNQTWWLQTQPVLLVDVGNFWKAPGKLMMGCEYEYFYNFLGIGIGDINHPQFVVQWNL